MDKRRHQVLMVEYLEQRRDELISVWEDARNEHFLLKHDIDEMFVQYLERLDEQIRAWDIGD